MSTHTFNLTSGVEVEVNEMTGREQRILTEQKKGTDFNDSLNEIMANVVVRIGSTRNPSKEYLKNLLSSDRKKILIEIRQFSLEFEPIFKFRWEYVNKEGQKATYDLEINLEGGFPVKPLLVPKDSIGENGKYVGWVNASYKEYEEIQKEMKLVLPRSGKEITWHLLDSVGETIGSNTPKSQRSSHTPILMRRPLEIYQAKTDKVPIQLALDDLSLKDIEALRAEIKRVEGDVDTIITFEHPEAEFMSANEKNVFIDVLGVQAFFFPSEAI